MTECPPEVAAQFGRAEAKFTFDDPELGALAVVVVDEHAGWQQVGEAHYCDRWELLDGGYRCGLTFGDGHRCHVTHPEPGRSWSMWTYLRPVPDGPTCGNCGLSIARTPSTSTGWTHVGGWEGVRCPGRLTGARPDDPG